MKFSPTYRFSNFSRGIIVLILSIISSVSISQTVVNNPCNVGSQPNWPLDGVCYPANTNGMSPLFNPGSCNSAFADDAWATFTGDGNNITITYNPSSVDAVLHVFSATAPCSVTQVGCSDVGWAGGAETVTLTPSVLGQVYFVRIQRYNNNANMTGCLSISTAGGGGGGDNCANADRIDCGDPTLAGESSIGNTNDSGLWSCLNPIATPGGDHYYVVQWPDAANSGTIRIAFTNVVDANDTYMEVLSLGNACASNTCTDANQLTIATGLFPTANNFIEYSVPAGIADYYFVVDAQNDGITSYDITVTCFLTGLEVDVTNGCTPIPVTAPANQGFYQTWDGAEPPATQDPSLLTGTYTICENIYILNVGWEWLKTFDITLGACWINTSNYTPNGANTGFYSLCGGQSGTWSASLAGNVISWAFVHPTSGGCGNTTWGDGNLLNNNYTCALYSFCYDAEVDPACPIGTTFQNGISATDDGIGGGGGSGVNPSNITLGSTSPTVNTLPITLISFDAKAVIESGKYGVVLNWKTASEINNDYFTIERSTDGINFEELFQMKGAGTSNDINSYIGVDKNPNNGINYYRLKQTDFDGQFEYFNIEVVDIANFVDITLSPNIVESDLNVVFTSKNSNSEFQLKIFDTQGRIVYNQSKTASKGLNEIDINAGSLAQGLYTLTIENEGQFHKQKFVKE